MNITQTLALYDEEQRRLIEYPGMQRESAQHVVRHVDLVGTDSVVIYSTLVINNADTQIQKQISYFDELGHDFEWKYYEHDSPPDLKTRLAANRFEIGEVETIVALELAEISEELMRPSIYDIRKITDPRQIGDVMIVQDKIWRTNEDSLARRQILYELHNAPDSISVYVAYVDDKPVASSWIRFTSASCFASLWAGSTLPAFRRRGIYTAMLAIRAREALQRGKRFLTVDAGAESLPILKRLGFQVLTLSYPCQWRSGKSD